MCDYVGKEWHSYQYYLRLEKGDKVLIRFTTSPDNIVEIADEHPETDIYFSSPNNFKRKVKDETGHEYMENTCLMLYCDSLQELPLGIINKLPDDFNPLKY